MNKNSGNILFLILIAVALFAALTYTITYSSRNSGDGGLAREQAKLDTGVAEQCFAHVQRGVNILQVMNGCAAEEISYELPNGQNENPLNPNKKECFLFDEDGAGIFACGIYASGDCPPEILSNLEIGQVGCGFIIYAGNSGGRIYTTMADAGTHIWASNTPSVYRVTGASSRSDGQSNTNILVSLTGHGAPYVAANACSSLGDKWYLPALNEFRDVLYNNRNIGALAGSFSYTDYWTSSEHVSGDSFHVRMSNGTTPTGWKAQPKGVRCIRKD